MNEQQIVLDVSKEPFVPPTLYLGQGDKNGTTIVAEIYDNGIPLTLTSYSVRFEMRLPDGTSYYQSPAGTASGNVATIPIDETYAATVDGMTSIAYIVVYDNSTVCSTSRVNVIVLESAENGADPAHAYSSGIIEATEAANAAAASATTSAGLADTAATAATSAASSATSAASSATSAASSATTAAAAADAAREAIQDDLAAKADADAYAPLLTAGVADSLLSSDEQTATFAQRVSDHDGSVGVRAILGNTVVWNQLTHPATSGETIYEATFTPDGNGKVVVNGTVSSSGNAQYQCIQSAVQIAEGHKYLMKGCPPGGSTDTYYITASAYSVTHNPNDTGAGAIFQGYSSGSTILYILVKSGVNANNLAFYPQLFDLTAMFGAGNEPATVAKFEQLFPADYYPYDAGSLQSVNIEGITSAGMTRTIPASTYFPDGLRGVGTAYDELDFVNHKAVTRIGAVDLGTLNWTYHASGQFRVAFTNAVRPTAQSIISNIVCVPYATVPFNNSGIGSIDKSIARYYSSIDGLNIRDDSFNGDVNAFKSAMSGVMLYYEIADSSNDTIPNPTETDLPETLQATYPVETGGTESIVIPTGEQSAPPTMAIVYAYDADGIRDEIQSIVAPVERGVASSNYAVGAYLVMGGTLYRVTTAIATGETITPGSNCTATTVMAELIRLTA